MTELTWHLERAKIVLEEWYLSADFYIRQENFFLNLVIPSRKYSGIVRRKALHCKTAGLVWHDRYKMLLDVQRGMFK